MTVKVKVSGPGQGSKGNAGVVESDSDWEAGSAFCVDEEDPWSDSISLCGGYNSVFEDGNGLSLFSDTDDAEILDLPNGFEEDWSNI